MRETRLSTKRDYEPTGRAVGLLRFNDDPPDVRRTIAPPETRVARHAAVLAVRQGDRSPHVHVRRRRSPDGLLPRPRDRRRAVDDRQRLHLHHNRTLRELLHARESLTSAPGPTQRAPTARSSATSRPAT